MTVKVSVRRVVTVGGKEATSGAAGQGRQHSNNQLKCGCYWS